MSFQVTPYRCINFIPGSENTKETVEKEASKVAIIQVASVPVSTAVGFAIGIPLALLNPASLLVVPIAIGSMVLAPFAGSGFTATYYRNSLSDSFKASSDLFTCEIDRIDDVDRLARSFLGMLGVTEDLPKTEISKLETLRSLTKDRPPLYPAFTWADKFIDICSPPDYTCEFERYKKIASLRVEIWSDKQTKLDQICSKLFSIIDTNCKLKNEMTAVLKELNALPINHSNPPVCRPNIELSSPFDLNTSEVRLNSYFLGLEDLQRLASAVIEATGSTPQDFKDEKSLVEKAKKEGDFTTANNLERKIYNHLVERATFAIGQNLHNLKVLTKRMKAATPQKTLETSSQTTSRNLEGRVLNLEQKVNNLGKSLYAISDAISKANDE